MPYNGERVEGNEQVRERVKRFDLAMFIGEVPEADLERAETLQMEHSSFSDPGEDWNKVHLFDKDGGKFRSFHIAGY